MDLDSQFWEYPILRHPVSELGSVSTISSVFTKIMVEGSKLELVVCPFEGEHHPDGFVHGMGTNEANRMIPDIIKPQAHGASFSCR